MLKKLLFLAISLASVLFAQGTYEPSEVEESYSYDTQEETSQPQQINHQSVNNKSVNTESEPSLYIGIHPVSLLILTAVGIPTVYLTIEKTIAPKASLVFRPMFMTFDQSSDDINLSLLAFGITGGYRHYFRNQHKGFYLEGELQIAYVNIKASDDYDHAKATATAFGPYIMIGRKWTFGSMALSVDAGVGYNIISLSIDSSDDEFDRDIENVTSSPFGYDFNLIWSFGI